MPLPKECWIIDFVTARLAFSAGDNQLIATFIGMCENGRLFCCYCEEPLFRRHDGLRPPFLEDQDCALDLDDDVVGRLRALHAAVNGGLNGKRTLPGTDHAKQIVATAIVKDFGVITSKVSETHVTAKDMCDECDVPTLTLEEFKDQIN